MLVCEVDSGVCGCWGCLWSKVFLLGTFLLLAVFLFLGATVLYVGL